ncbi:TPA: phage tail protein [Pseudomonas putida]|nr:phage tail protein [Pseudomonas putida]
MVDQTSQFYAILTNIGSAKQANADALGIPWTFTHMAVGDGNPAGVENPPQPMPVATQTALLNEWRRAPLNQLKIDPANAAVIIAEQIIPADEGGKWIRELALFDADGDMVAVANCPPTFKPLLSQGSGRTQVVRLNLIVSSSSNVQLKIDPSVVLATREWVTEELAKQDFKHSVVAATTASINLSGLQTVDGVVLTAGARVLVKNQATAKDNGLYLVVAGGAWTRCPDADSSAKVTPGMLVLVERGTVNAESAWQLVTDAPITLGVTALTYEMAFGRTGVAAGTYRSVTVDAYGRVTAATNPTTVAGYGLTDVYTKTQIDQALALKAALASPDFSGTPLVPTAAAGTNTRQAASTAFVLMEIARLVASSPAALDTLNELAAALGNDPNFATTMTNALSLKAPLASPDFSGTPLVPTAPTGTSTRQAASTAFVSAVLALYGVGQALEPTETDLNKYTTPGNFITPQGGMTNLPQGWSPNTRYSLVVDGYGASRYLVQTITTGLPQGVSIAQAQRTMSAAGVWSPWHSVWNSNNTPRQADALDLTAAALLNPGSFGVGSAIVTTEVDMNNFQIPGNYLTAASGLLNMPPGWNASQRHSMVVDGLGASGHLVQTLTAGLAGGEPKQAIRTFTSGKTWTDWEEVTTGRHLPIRGRVLYRSAGVYQWTVPPGVTKVDVEVRGGGGSGGFNTQDVGANGGGGGGISKRLCAVTPGTVITVTVGAGGAGVSTVGASGNAGGTSSFGALCSATGGGGGGATAAVGGVGAGGDFNASMGPGSPSVRNAGGTYALGGAGGGGESIPATSHYSVPTQPGMGGGGRTSNQSQPGADGCVFITY